MGEPNAVRCFSADKRWHRSAAHVLRRPLLVISAPDRAGKTAFARTLFKDLRRNGIIPLLLSADRIRFAFDTFKLGKEDLGIALRRRIKQRHPEMPEEGVAGLANSITFMLVNMFTYAVIRHIAGSIGVEKLALTFKEVRESKNTIAVRTLDAAIQLEHFENVPESLVIELYKEVKDVLLMQDIVRHLAWDRMYYFRCPQSIQQRLCSALGIELSAATFNPDPKKR